MAEDVEAEEAEPTSRPTSSRSYNRHAVPGEQLLVVISSLA